MQKYRLYRGPRPTFEGWARQRGRFEELSLEGVKCKSINFTGARAPLLKAGLGKGVALRSSPWKGSIYIYIYIYSALVVSVVMFFRDAANNSCINAIDGPRTALRRWALSGGMPQRCNAARRGSGGSPRLARAVHWAAAARSAIHASHIWLP